MACWLASGCGTGHAQLVAAGPARLQWQPPSRRRWRRSPATAGRVPPPVMHLVLPGQPVTEELLVVAFLHVMGLEPHPRHMDRVAVRGESPVRVEDVGADVARAGDHVRGVVAGLPEVLGAEF